MENKKFSVNFESHTYENHGVYTKTLVFFNEKQGYTLDNIKAINSLNIGESFTPEHGQLVTRIDDTTASTETYIDTTEFPTRASTWDQITFIDQELCDLENEIAGLDNSDDRDDCSKKCSLEDDAQELHDQMCALRRHYNRQPSELNHEQPLVLT